MKREERLTFTPVTVESFNEWNKAFLRTISLILLVEMEALNKDKKKNTNQLTGR